MGFHQILNLTQPTLKFKMTFHCLFQQVRYHKRNFILQPAWHLLFLILKLNAAMLAGLGSAVKPNTRVQEAMGFQVRV